MKHSNEAREANGRMIMTWKIIKVDCMKEHRRMSIAYQQDQGGTYGCCKWSEVTWRAHFM